MLDSVELSCPLVFAACNKSCTIIGYNLFPETLRESSFQIKMMDDVGLRMLLRFKVRLER